MLITSSKSLGLCAGLVALAAPCATSASSLYLNPVRLVLTPDKRTALLSVRNDGAAPLSFRLQAMGWSQQNGGDVRSLSSDLVLSPPIATVAPGAVQLVRIGPKSRDLKSEHAYRVIVQEIPSPETGGKISLALKFDLPFYISPARVTPPSASWQARDSGTQLQVDADNLGTSHFEVHQIYLTGSKVPPLVLHGADSVVLAHSRKTWTLPAAWRSKAALDIVADTSAGIAHIRVSEGAR